MEINDKKLKRTTKIINWVISVVLGLLLISLSNLIIDDLDNTVACPNYDSFVDQTAL